MIKLTWKINWFYCHCPVLLTWSCYRMYSEVCSWVSCVFQSRIPILIMKKYIGLVTRYIKSHYASLLLPSSSMQKCMVSIFVFFLSAKVYGVLFCHLSVFKMYEVHLLSSLSIYLFIFFLLNPWTCGLNMYHVSEQM